MRTRLAIRTHAFMERMFPERRLFLKSETDTRFIRLKPETQALVYLGLTLFVAWSIVATAIVLMDSIGSNSFRDQARRDQILFQERLNAMSRERDSRAAEALAAQERFNAALAQVSVMQSELLASETRRNELSKGIGVIQATLRDTMKQREAARAELAALKQETAEAGTQVAAAAPAPLVFMAEALEETAAERDRILADAQSALSQRDEMEL
ncbi:DUF5930 domain-containing protein, partial [Pseudooceanicola sp.]|uniref:DUF5930 domain-containing protein n=1 Tax=Pseudooceanicola sp. TaxID=1914328 RepID=UPI003511B1BE